MKIDKVIASNHGALVNKYGAVGTARIESSIRNLVQADKARGLVSRVLWIDDAHSMATVNGTPVMTVANCRENKEAFDAIATALAPDYILIVGATDIVPHQDLKNPLYVGPNGDDPDQLCPGDLPYACDAPYSQKPQDFQGPSRVVGRLPDIVGAKDPEYLEKVLGFAAGWHQSARARYADAFSVTAQVWEKSSRLSADAIFGAKSPLESVPPGNQPWPNAELKKAMHFFNCHGAQSSSQFYGQPAKPPASYPVALDGPSIDSKISEGTVVAAECCYGAELYEPAPGLPEGICNFYLGNGAYGFLGSSTIAYGPASSNAQADLICSYFLEGVLSGASLGRALLEARQRFVKSSVPLDPTELKTLAQFHLLGDPSIQPVIEASSNELLDQKFVFGSGSRMRAARADRRRSLIATGTALWGSAPLVERTGTVPEKVKNALAERARERALVPGDLLSFAIRQRPSMAKVLPAPLAKRVRQPTRFHVLFAAAEDLHPGRRSFTVLVAREVAGEIVSIRETASK